MGPWGRSLSLDPNFAGASGGGIIMYSDGTVS